LVKQLSEKVRT
jgi:hypothetical protein